MNKLNPSKATILRQKAEEHLNKRSAKAVMESEVEFKNLVWDMQVGVLLQGSKSEILLSNPKALELLGLSEDQLIGKTSFDPDWNVIHEDGSPFPGETHPVPQAIATHKSVHDVVMGVYRPEKGDRVWLKVDAELQFNKDNSIRQVVCSFIDITIRKLAEEALKKSERNLKVANEELEKTIDELLAAKEKAEISEKKWRILFEIPETSLLILDIEGKFLTINEQAARQFGLPKSEIEGKTLFDLFPIEVAQKYYQQNKFLIETGGRIDYEDTHLLNGKVVTFSVVDRCLQDENGKNYALLSSSIDISDRKLFEKELVKSKELAEKNENFFRSTLDNLLEGCQILGFDWRFLYVNDSAAKQGRKPKDEFIGRTIMEVLPDIEDTEFFVRLKLSMEERKALHMLNEFKYYDGLKGWFELSFQPVEEGVFILSIDVTERKRAELQLQEKNKELEIAKEKTEESDRLKSAFLANMSHEIRTPMNGILGFAELLKEPNLSGESQQVYIKIIEKSGARMLNIINDIIDISKIETGLMTLNTEKSDINGQIEYIFTFFKPEAEAKGIKLSFNNSLPAKGAIITTDREKLYAILINLVKNAIKYSNEGAIDFGYEVVETSHDLSLLQFYVKDTGIGIPKDRQSAIFERFIQADIDDKMARQGAGLGLSISKAYVEMLGGKIWVESEEGIGSTFYFTIPYNAESVEKQIVEIVDPTQNEKLQIKDLKILIAEDDGTSEMLISIIVKEFSKEIFEARTGKEAVEICQKNPDIDLILMDIQMFEMNGYKATQQIRQFNKDVIIIAQTAFGLSGDREKAIEAGCNDYISKPIVKDELLSIIQKCFKEQEKK